MKKIISIFICAILLLSSISIMSYAVTFEIPGVSYDALKFPGERITSDTSVRAKRFNSNGNNSFLFYDQLSTAAKAVYDALLDANMGLDTDDGIMTLTISGNAISGTTSNISSTLSKAVVDAISAIIDDYPEYFWVGGFSYGGASYSYINSSTVAITSVSEFYFADGISDTSSYADFATVKAAYKQMIADINNFNVDGYSRYEKVKSIHDQIADMTTYDSTYNAAMSHHPTGVFLNGLAVCEGYAEAFKLLCDRESIPCIIIIGDGFSSPSDTGGAHEWNAVQMEDGNWYGIDVTWDDQQGSIGIIYDYFLPGTGTHNFGVSDQMTWAASHVEGGSHFSISTAITLSYPTQSTISYSAILPLFDTTVTFDAPNLKVYIGKNATLANQFWVTYSAYSAYAPSDNAASISGRTTGATLNITSPVSRTYTVIRWGDVDANNSVNNTDAALIKNHVLGSSSINDTNGQGAADFNHDGVVDGYDYIYMELYLNDAVSK